MPETPAAAGGSPAGELRALRRPQVWQVAATAALGFAGMIISTALFAMTAHTGPARSSAPSADGFRSAPRRVRLLLTRRAEDSAMTGLLTTRADAAQTIAEALLGDMGDRWRHTIGVAERAAELADRLGLDPDVLVSAAWLHDIGYAAPIAHTGFHPLDGAVHLTVQGWPERIAGLVAHHSGARFVAEVRGFAERLSVFVDEPGLVTDALTYADQTTSPRGERVDPGSRYAEMLRRHGPCSANALVDASRGPHLRAITARIEPLLHPTPAC